MLIEWAIAAFVVVIFYWLLSLVGDPLPPRDSYFTPAAYAYVTRCSGWSGGGMC